MKTFILTFLLFLWVATASAQNTAIADSLKKQLTSSKPDTNRVLILIQLSLLYYRADPEISKKYAQKGLTLAQNLNDKKGESRCLTRIGFALHLQGLDPQALRIALQASKLNETVNDPDELCENLRLIGIIHADQGDYQKAMHYLFRAKKVSEFSQNPFAVPRSLMSIGNTYFKFNRFDSALVYLQQALVASRQGGTNRLMDNLLTGIGQVQAKMGKNQEAMRSFRMSMPYSMLDSDHSNLSESYLGIAQLFQKMGRPDSSIFYAQKALAEARTIHFLKGILAASQLLSQVYAGSNEAESFRYYKIAMTAKDSLFSTEKVRQIQNLGFLEQQRQQNLEAAQLEYQNKVKLYGLLAALVVFSLLALSLYRNNRTKQKANKLLKRQKEEIAVQRTKAEDTLTELKATQIQLIQKEKMASLGELTAGIAHEIQNPLNFVNNFSEVSAELVGELREEEAKANRDPELIGGLFEDLTQNLEKITLHGQRASNIVRGMLEHSRTSTGEKQPTDLNALVEEYLHLAYHGLRAKDNTFHVELKTDFDSGLGSVNVVPQELGRVLLNLFNNAFYAVQQRASQGEAGYQPTVSVSTKHQNGRVEIRVQDNGTGIPDAAKQKIFQPFFTTKPPGEGTGLGLSLSYDIVIKGHGGTLTVESSDGLGTTFLTTLPHVSK